MPGALPLLYFLVDIEEHEVAPGPPIKLEVNALILTVNLCALCSKRQLPFGVLCLFLPAFL